MRPLDMLARSVTALAAEPDLTAEHAARVVETVNVVGLLLQVETQERETREREQKAERP